MAGKTFSKERKMEAVMDYAEQIPFPLGWVPRGGLLARGISPAQTLGSHVASLTSVSSACVMVFHLSLDLELVYLLCHNDDCEKAIMGDHALVEEEASISRFQSVRKFVNRLRRREFSLDERQEERVGALEALRPTLDLLEAAPELVQSITRSRQIFFRKNRGAEARFVHDIGKVMDRHVYFWRLRQIGEEPTERDIRTFTQSLNRKLNDKTAKLYWKMVKLRYLGFLEPVYGSRRRALAQ